MRVNLYEQEYLSIKRIAEEWAKEPGKLSAKEIEQEIWRTYWLGDFVDENGEPTFVIPYEDREYIEKGPLPLHIISEAELDKHKDEIKYAAIIYSEGKEGVNPLHFFVRYLGFPPRIVEFSEMYNHIIKNNERDKAAEEKYYDEFLVKIKKITLEHKNVGKASLPFNDDFTIKLRMHHIFDLEYKQVTKYVALHRAFLFNYLYSSGLLKFKPKCLPEWSGKGEEAILTDASDEDYKNLSEQNLNFLDKEFESKQFLQAYLEPCIRPVYLINVCKKLGVKVPNFLDTVNINVDEISEQGKKKETRGRKAGKPSEKYSQTKFAVINLLCSMKNTETKSENEILNTLYTELNKMFPEDKIPEEGQMKRYIKEFKGVNGNTQDHATHQTRPVIAHQ